MRRIGSHARQRRADGDRQAETAFVDERFELARDVQHERTQHERLRMHLESAGGDLRDVEHLIDEMSQMRRRRGDAVDRRHLSRREIAVDAVLEQLDESDDRVERRAQLVRDVGEKLALRRVRARHFAVQPLELRRPLGDANRLAALANDAEAEKRRRS